MRTLLRSTVLVVLAALLAACAGTTSSPSASSAPATTASPSASAAGSASASAEGSASAEPSASAGVSPECQADNLQTKTPGTLTIGTDNPAFPPYFLPREGGNNEPWDPSQGDPTTGDGFESAVAYAIAEALGFTEDQVEWVVVPICAPSVASFRSAMDVASANSLSASVTTVWLPK